MKQIFTALLVFVCSINVKVVLSQFSFGSRGGFSNSYSSPPLGTSLNFLAPGHLHHIGSGSTFLSSRDTFTSWPNTNSNSPSGWYGNTGVLSFAPAHVKNDNNPIFPDLDKQKPLLLSSKDTTPTTSTTSRPQYERFHHYGNTFGRNWLLKNTYIARNSYYESEPPLGPGPLAKALFSQRASDDFNVGIKWDKNDDKKWRATTRAPYFENQVPGENKILPASAVVGAATAFGLVSMLPIRVPKSKPLMYCGSTNLKQMPIKIFDEIYSCNNDTFEISCEENFRNQSNFNCATLEMKCDVKNEETMGNIYCEDKTLFSKLDIFCDKAISINETDEAITFLNCHEGSLPKHLESFIPTTTSRSTTTQASKPLSIGAKAHIFLLKLIGKFEVLEEKAQATPESYPSTHFDAWHPEALTVSPDA